MTIAFDHYMRYDELTAALRELEATYPGLVSVQSIGRSYQERDIWLATVTDTSTGPHDQKPAMWVDGNIHASELTASVCALHLVHALAAGFGDDPAITRALRTRTFYVVPRVNPDGAERILADRPSYLRSSVRPWPWTDGRAWPGLHSEDIDGDGRVCTMRIEDPDGAWKPHPDEPRLMVHRAPDDDPEGGPYYRLLAEGRVEDHDGFTVPSPPPVTGLDMNRNFPAGWGTSVAGSGDFPTSEPEIAALVRAIHDRPNICGYNAYHTFGGALLRPSSTRADRDLPPDDVWVYGELGKRCTELTTYPVHSVYEDFTWDPSETMSGAADDWAYEHKGVYGWTTEFWDVIFHATGTRAPTKIWYTGPSDEEELAVLRWYEEHYGRGVQHRDWTPFDHPQLGRVEIGGWDWLTSWSNPPGDRLHDEVRHHAAFAVFQALAAPELALRHLRAEPLGEGTWRVTAGVANIGWLPTTVTAWAAKHKLVQPVVAELEVPPDGELVGQPARVQLGQLAGRSRVRLHGGSQSDGTDERALASWVVRAPAGAEVTVTASHPRAGRVAGRIVLGS